MTEKRICYIKNLNIHNLFTIAARIMSYKNNYNIFWQKNNGRIAPAENNTPNLYKQKTSPGWIFMLSEEWQLL